MTAWIAWIDGSAPKAGQMQRKLHLALPLRTICKKVVKQNLPDFRTPWKMALYQMLCSSLSMQSWD